MHGTLSFYECRFSSGDTQNPETYMQKNLNFLHSQVVGHTKTLGVSSQSMLKVQKLRDQLGTRITIT